MNKTRFVIVYNDAGQAGLQDENGQLVVPCQYDKILDYDDDGYIRMQCSMVNTCLWKTISKAKANLKTKVNKNRQFGSRLDGSNQTVRIF